MKIFRIILLCVLFLKLGAQNTWLQDAGFPATARQGISTFEINNKIYMVGGWDFTNFYKETWEYDIATNTWTQKATFPGAGRQEGFAFVLNNIGYYGSGESGGFPTNYLSDFWAYDPAADAWTQKNNFSAGSGAVSFVVNGNAYVGTGTSSSTTYLGDMWQYNPVSDTWTAKAPFGGTPRRYASAFVIGTKAYVGTGQGSTGHGNTFYEYNSATDSWAQKSGYPVGMSTGVGFAFNGKGYLGTGYDGASYQQGFYEYNPIADSWTAKANFGGGIRGGAAGIAVNGKGYICAGYGSGLHNDLWEYTASTPTAPVAGFSLPSSICIGSCITITDQAANSPDYYTWSMAGSGTASATVQNPTGICYNTLGTFTVTQIVSNPFGADTLSKTITVKSVPSLTVSVNAGTICAGQVATAIASGASYYSWSSGQSTATVSLAPSTTTSYTVTGTAANGCTGTKAISITVNPKPGMSIAGTHSICMGSSQVYTATGALTYTWSANAGGVNTNTISVSPTVATTYSVTGSNTYNCTNTASVSVSILPTPTVTASGSASVCAGSSVTYTAGGASTYTWSTGATTSTMSAVAMSGTIYTVTGKGANNCVNTATVSASVLAGPSVTAGSSNSVICQGNTATLSAGGASTYTWSANAGGVNTSTVLVSPGMTTTYTVTGANSNCSSTASVSVTVSTPSISIAGTPSLCAGSATGLTASGANTYTWSTGENASSVTVAPPASAVYSVTGSNMYNCTATASINISVAPVPTVTAVNSNSSICAGSTASLTAGGANTYTWSNSAVSPAISVSPANSSTYSVIGADANQCRDTAFVSITVLPVPGMSTTGTGSICAGTGTTLAASGADTYSWSTGATTPSISVMPTVNSTYTVTGTGTNGCTLTQTLSVIIDNGCVTTGINEPSGEHSTYAYPNPASEALTVTSSLELQEIELTSFAGELIISEKASGNKHQVQLSGLAPGIYFIHVYSDNHVISREKIVVQR